MSVVAIVARKKCAATTRAAMLCAARERFLRESYENVGLRDVARDAGVDVALVGRYFGSKADLFREVLRAGKSETFKVDVGREELPAYLASLLQSGDDAEARSHAEGLLILLRSASSPTASKIVVEAVREDVLGPIAALLAGDHADLRAGLCLAVLMGTTMLRAIMSVEPACDGDPSLLDRKLIALFETALSEVG
jgi:AcrR family transcriptional regulator